MKFITTSNRFAETNTRIIRLIKDITGIAATEIDAELDALDELIVLGGNFDRLLIKIAETNAKIDELIDIQLDFLKTCSPDEVTRSANPVSVLASVYQPFSNNPKSVMFPVIELVTQDEIISLITGVYESLPETPESGSFLTNFGYGLEGGQIWSGLVRDFMADPEKGKQQLRDLFISQFEKVSITHESPVIKSLLESGKKLLLGLVKDGFATDATKPFTEKMASLVESFSPEVVKAYQSIVTGDVKAENVTGEIGNFVESCANGDFRNTAFGKMFADTINSRTRANSGGLPWWETVGTAPLEYENALNSAIQGFQEVITRWDTNPMDVILNDKIRELLKLVIRPTSHTELDAEIQELLKDTYVVSHNTDLNDEIQEVKNSHDVSVVTTVPAGSDRDASDDDSCSSCDGCSVCGACRDFDDDSPAPGTPDIFPEAGPSQA